MRSLKEIIPSYTPNMVKLCPTKYDQYQSIVDKVLKELNPNEDNDESFYIPNKMSKYALNAALDELVLKNKDADKFIYLDRTIFNYLIDKSIENRDMDTRSHRIFNSSYFYLDNAVKITGEYGTIEFFDINAFHRDIDPVSYEKFLRQELESIELGKEFIP